MKTKAKQTYKKKRQLHLITPYSPYQRGGTIFRQPPNPWGFTNYKPYEIDPWIARRVRKQKGGKVHPVIYP